MPEYISTAKMSMEEWRAKRSYSIGASEAGAVLGLNPYRSPLDVYLQKIGEQQPDEENLAMTIGTFMEPLARRLFEEETGFKCVKDNKIRIDPEYDFLTTNLDGMVIGEKVPLEIKTATQWDIEEIPDWYYCQLQHQLMVSGYQKIYFAVIVLGFKKTFVVDEFPRNQAFIDNMRHQLVQFWNENVQKRIPPDPISYEEASRVYSRFDPDKTVEAPDEEFKKIAIEDRNHKAQIKILESKIDKGKTKVANLMKESETLLFDEEVMATWRNNKDGEKFDYDQFEKDNPLLAKKYTVVKPGARVLRFNKKIGEQVDEKE